MKTIAIALLLSIWTAPAVAQQPGPSRQSNAGASPLSFANLERRSTPNDYLVCPPDHCARADSDHRAPVFELPASALTRAVRSIVADAPRTELFYSDDTRIVAVQRTRVFRFPDRIDVEIIPLGLNRATLAIYSRARYGFYDFGVNRRRVEGWLNALDTIARPQRY